MLNVISNIDCNVLYSLLFQTAIEIDYIFSFWWTIECRLFLYFFGYRFPTLVFTTHVWQNTNGPPSTKSQNNLPSAFTQWNLNTILIGWMQRFWRWKTITPNVLFMKLGSLTPNPMLWTGLMVISFHKFIKYCFSNFYAKLFLPFLYSKLLFLWRNSSQYFYHTFLLYNNQLFKKCYYFAVLCQGWIFHSGTCYSEEARRDLLSETSIKSWSSCISLRLWLLPEEQVYEIPVVSLAYFGEWQAGKLGQTPKTNFFNKLWPFGRIWELHFFRFPKKVFSLHPSAQCPERKSELRVHLFKSCCPFLHWEMKKIMASNFIVFIRLWTARHFFLFLLSAMSPWKF